MPRIVIHNYATRNVGRFRATAAVHDHGSGGCSCGGTCGDCSQQRDSTSKADLAIDVRYIKGGYGRPKIFESRHYVVSDVIVDPRGHAPGPEFVRSQLYRQPGHREMSKEGWSVDHIEGYYKSEQRDTGRRI
jgi:hypothetical protein